MKELLAALKLRKEYNKKPFEEVVKDVQQYTKVVFTREYLDDWIFAGLLNTDFVNLHVDD